MAQMQAYASCDDPEIRAVVREGYGDLFTWTERVIGLPAELGRFFAKGMLLNVVAAMDLAQLGRAVGPPSGRRLSRS